MKKKIAEKEKVLQVTRSKIIEPTKDINANNAMEGKGLVTRKMPSISHLNSRMILLPSLHKDISVLSSSACLEKVNTNSLDMVYNSTLVDHSNTSKTLENSKVEVKDASKIGKNCTTEESKMAKKCTLMRSYIHIN